MRTREQIRQVPEEKLNDIEADFRCWGLYVGQLTPIELMAFDMLVEHGRARRVYEGAGQLFGLAKVRRA